MNTHKLGMMTYNCIIIDDEPHSVEHLVECIKLTPALKLVKAYTDASIALTEIMEMKCEIDILFTDIEMPNLSGLAIAEKVKDKVRFLIFVSGHSEYAMNGYGLNVKEFLLKPFDHKRFEKFILATINRLALENPYIFLKAKEDKAIIKICLDDIIFIEANGNYVKVQTREKSSTFIQSLADIEIKLRNHPYFLKIHKSYIASLKHIEKFKDDFVYLSNGATLSVGHKYKEKFARRFLAK